MCIIIIDSSMAPPTMTRPLLARPIRAVLAGVRKMNFNCAGRSVTASHNADKNYVANIDNEYMSE
jgi:hypothetical protein